MLTVRAEQMFVFRDAAASRFEARMLDYLRQSYPALHASRGDEAMQGLVRKAMSLARRQGIEGVGSVSVLVDLMARFGEDFEASGDAGRIHALLARRELPAEVRLESIIKHLTAKTGGRVLTRAGDAVTASQA